eukprot:scaffold15060_cov131-Isochrysis_galbana.AAC.1
MDCASAPSLPDCVQSRRRRQPSQEDIRHPEGDVTASAAQLDTQSVSHAVAGRVLALAQYSRQPANRPEGLAGTVQPPVALEVAARVAALRQILTF